MSSLSMEYSEFEGYSLKIAFYWVGEWMDCVSQVIPGINFPGSEYGLLCSMLAFTGIEMLTDWEILLYKICLILLFCW